MVDHRRWMCCRFLDRYFVFAPFRPSRDEEELEVVMGKWNLVFRDWSLDAQAVVLARTAGEKAEGDEVEVRVEQFLAVWLVSRIWEILRDLFQSRVVRGSVEEVLDDNAHFCSTMMIVDNHSWKQKYSSPEKD